jgi:hypothetical protein
MKRSLFILSSIVLFLIGCKAIKKVSVSTEKEQTDVIQIAITSFYTTCSLFRKDSVFQISTRESSNDKNILIVSIGRNNTKMLLSSDVKIGSKGKIASKYLEREGKLFYWWDDNYPLTNEAFAIFGKYNLLQDDEGGMIKFPDNFLDEKQKYAFYYFCKNNLAIYKRVITNKGWFYEHSPEIDCKCDSLKN